MIRFISANIVRSQREGVQERCSAHITDLKQFHTDTENSISEGDQKINYKVELSIFVIASQITFPP